MEYDGKRKKTCRPDVNGKTVSCPPSAHPLFPPLRDHKSKEINELEREFFSA